MLSKGSATVLCWKSGFALVFTTWSQTSSVNSLLFSVPIGLVTTHICIYTHVSHFAFNCSLNLYFRLRQGLLQALLASSLSSKLLPTRQHQSLPLTIICRGICPLQRSIGNNVSCWSPVPSLALFLRYPAERWQSPFQISWPSEDWCFWWTWKHWILCPSATKESVFRGRGREKGRKEVRKGNGEQANVR